MFHSASKQSNVIIHCSDPRVVKWLNDEKIRQTLSIDQGNSTIANTGSIKFYLNEGLMDKLYKQLEILVVHFAPEKIILLNHTGCGYYKSIGMEDKNIQINDLETVRVPISAKFPKIKVESWLIETESGKLKQV